MLVRSSIFNQMSGKFNGAVAMESRAGLALRSHVVPANPKTRAQQEVRNALKQVAALFFSTGLSGDQRDAWTRYAAGETYTARLGGTYKPTASQAFVAVNAVRVQLGLTPVVAPPPNGRAPAALTLAWAGTTVTATYPAPAAGIPDALAVGGAIRLYVARRPIYQNRRYGPWDATATLLGQNPRPTADSLTLETGAEDAGYQVYYRLIGTTPTGQPLDTLEGSLVTAGGPAVPVVP